MAEIDLTTVPLSALTAEIRRRRDEWEAAQKDLAGLGLSDAIFTMASLERSKGLKPQTAGAAVTAAAQRLRHARDRKESSKVIAEFVNKLAQARERLAAEKGKR